MKLRVAALAILSFTACVEAPPPPIATLDQATTVCGGAASVHGMDVSAYETSIDWSVAKANGIDFAFIRVSDGLQYHDPKFAEYWQGAHAAGVLRGAYQFFRPAQDPIAQADYLLAQIGEHQVGDLPPALDVETTSGLPPDEVEAAVRAWIEHVTAAIGRPPVIYAGYYSWQDYTGNANLTSSPLWHAQYTTAPCPNIPTPWTRWAFWQYTSTGSVPSVLGELTDLDVFDGTLDELRAFAEAAPPACGTIGPLGGEIDDADPCFAAGGPASTLRAVSTAGERGSLVWTKATAAALPGNFATWTLALAEAGRYRIEAYTAAPFAQSARAAYAIRAGGVVHRAVIDQGAVDGWQALGDFDLAAGGDQYVELDDDTGETGGPQLVFDAIRLVRLDPPPAGSDGSDGAVEPTADRAGCAVGGGVGGLAPGLCAALALVVRRRRLRR